MSHVGPILTVGFIMLVASAFLGSIANQTTGQTITTSGVVIANSSFETGSFTSWTQSCVRGTCTVTSGGAPDGTFYVHTSYNTAGNSGGFLDLTQNALSFSLSHVQTFQTWMRSPTTTACVVTAGVGTHCWYDAELDFNNGNLAVDFWYSDPQFTIPANSSSTFSLTMTRQCPWTQSAVFCNYSNPNMLTQAQAYFTGLGTPITSYTSAFIETECAPVSTGTCNNGVAIDYDLYGLGPPFSQSANNNVTSSPGLVPASLLLPLFVPLAAITFSLAYYRRQGGGTL